MYKHLGDVQFLAELGEDPQRGWPIIEDDGKARQWEVRLAAVGPVRVKEWADARGPKILLSISFHRGSGEMERTKSEGLFGQDRLAH
jgi:hypothetical protein